MTLADAQAIALAVDRKPSTIRSWAHRGLITRRGKDRRGRTLYSLEEAQELTARLGVETPVTMCNTDRAAVPVCPQPSAGSPGADICH